MGAAGGKAAFYPFVLGGDVEICWILVLAFLVLNLAASLLVWVDKRRAGSVEGRRIRVREVTFYLLGFIGAGPGLLGMMHRVRHKTRKTVFLVPLGVYSVLGIALWIALFWLLDCLPFV